MLSHDWVAGLNRWWVWRKGLGRLDFFENQPGLRSSGLDFAHWGETSAMERGQPQGLQRAMMFGRPIAAIVLPAVARPFTGMLGHHPVAGHLGDDRGGGDRTALGVAVDDRLRRSMAEHA